VTGTKPAPTSERPRVRGLREQLLRWMLPPIALLLALGGLLAYFSSIEPATAAYDLALTDAGLALGERIRAAEGGRYTMDLPGAADQVLRTDKYDTIYYRVRAPDGTGLAGDPDLPPPPPGAIAADNVIAYDTVYRGQQVRAVAVLVPCSGAICTVQVAETLNKRKRLVRGILLSSLLPETLVAAAMLAIVWFGVKRGVEPLQKLSEDIRTRTPRQLSPVDISHAPAEAHTLVSALNQLLERVSDANRNQQRFLANAAHQLRTPLAGLQAHAELAMAQADPAARQAALEHVHRATVRTVRLANQLLSLARAEPGGMSPALESMVDVKAVVEESADEWVHRALARGVDLGFELEDCRIAGDGFLLREAFANLVHNALEYTPRGGTVTVRAGMAGVLPSFEVDDEGPGIPEGERERVLERFYRVSGTPGEGSGLGLSIVQEIASLHGATLKLESGPGGKGTRVALVFPAAIR
jgi:two-component system sensor histidine kinase TctE